MRIELAIEHDKPLPEKQDITDVVSQRVYMWLYSQGCEAGVTAKRMDIVSEDFGSAIKCAGA